MPDHQQNVQETTTASKPRQAMSLREGLRALRHSPRDLVRLLAYARPYRARLAVALVSLFIAGGLGLLFPLVVRLLIDAAFVERNSARLNRLALTLIVLFITQAAFSFLRSYLLASTGERIVTDVRIQLYHHLTSLPVAFFASRRVGELTSRMASDIGVLQTVTTGSFTEMLRSGLLLVGGITIIAVTNLRLTLLMLAIVPVVIITAHFYGRYIRRLSTRVQDKLAEANAVLDESLAAIRIVQSFVREEYERLRYGTRVRESLMLARQRAVASGGFIAFIIFVVYSGIAVVLWFGSRMVLNGEMTAGELIAFVLYTFVVAGSIGGMTELFGQFNSAIGATRRVFELLDTEPEIKDPESPESLGQVRGQVELRGVRFTYPDERATEVIRGVH